MRLWTGFFRMKGGKKKPDDKTFWQQQAQSQNAALGPDPTVTAVQAQNTKVLDWENSSGKDIRDMPGMDAHIKIGQAAIDRAGRERMGGSGLNLADGGSSGYAQNLRSLRQNEMGYAVGAGLEDARAGIHSEARGSVLPLAQLQTGRQLGQAQHSLGVDGATPKKKSWWNYLQEGIGMAAQGAQVAQAFGA